MASGSFEFGTGNQYIIGHCDWSQQSNGSSANTSNVTVNVYFRRTNSYAVSHGTINTGVQCDSQSQWENNFSVSLSTGWVLTFARTFYNVPHNNDGSKTCYIRVCGNANFSLGSFDTSTNVGFDRIPRYTSVTEWKTTEIGQNYAKFKWSTADNINFARVYLNNNSQHTDIPGNVSGRTGEFTYIGMNEDSAQIPSKSTLSPGTTYNLKISVRRADSGLWTTSNNYQFTTTPIATLTNTSIDFNIGQDLILTFKDYENNKSYLALDVQKEDEAWEEVATVDEVLQIETFTWELSSIASTLYSKVVTRNSANIRIRCGTTIDDEKYYQTLTGIMSVVNSNPQFSNFSYGDVNTVTQKVLGNTSYMPEKLGNMQAHISVANKAVALNQAYIVQYIANIIDSSGKVVFESNIPYSSTGQIDFVFGSLSTAGTYTINIYAIDSRGNTSQTVTRTFYVLPYHSPVSNIVLRRLNNYEEETTISIRSQYSKLTIGNTNKNDSFNIKYRYAETGKDFTDTYTTITGLVSSSLNSTDMVVTFSANPFVNLRDQSNKSFNFEFQVIDKIGTILETIIVEQGIPLTFQSETGQLSVGMLPEWDSLAKLQVASDILATDKDGTKKLVLEEIDKINNDLFDLIYPVGICVEFATNINPNDVFTGQEWIRDAKGMVTVGVDEDDEDFNVINKTGGEKKHVLTTEELPSHNHSINRCADGTSGTNGTKLRYAMYNAVFLDSSNTSYTGSNKPHNNLQPYVTRYKWVRIR